MLGLKTGQAPITVAALLISASAGFAGACDRVSALEAFASSGTPPAGAACTTYQGQSRRAGVSCHWTFTFRADAANTQAADLWSSLKDCRAGAELGPDAQVNHPDSYDLREWSAGRDIYRVSVKDKGALGETLVFFRYENGG